MIIYLIVPTMVFKIVALNNVIEGEDLSLTCNIIGNPPTEISWYKGNFIYLNLLSFHVAFPT